jgi:hypothetical protein
MDKHCEICGGELTTAGNCSVCWGFRCSVCGLPVYRDESVAWTGDGKRHVRCAKGARPRPDYMPVVVSSQQAGV